VYCAAGAKGGVDAVASQFEKDTGVRVELTYANSGQLIGQIETTRKGDVYIPGDIGFSEKARSRGLISGEPRQFCYFVPAIYVKKGNPKGVKTVSDLVRSGTRLALADSSAAIGALQVALFRTNGIPESAIRQSTVASPATVIDVALAIKMGAADAGIVWDTLADYAPEEAEVVKIPVGKNVIGVISASVLNGAENISAARAFVDYLVSDKGKGILKSKNFTVEKPQ